ncbi:AzlC family ABC transporter permease [Roseibium sp. MMSF_3412]|uniref:AzlC family ABC transporter permease n=1 Tax=Roseibium sp. MMSF_3412 TaxID=3046712 RepID=UPI00273FCC9A|nr:AzlC family ABC transporter permease [Roseibium sp. MMSF_3412]
MTISRAGVLRGMTRLLPICLFVVPFGIAFGIAATEGGIGPIQATAMSAFVFTATAQFAALDFLQEPVAFFSLGLVALALSGRHLIMGAALAQWINRLPAGKRFVVLMFLSDANFADTQMLLQRGETDLGPLLGGGLMLWITWVGSTAAGAFGGNLLGNTEALGFGVVMLCFFAATAFGMVRSTPSLLLPVIVAVVTSAITLPYLPNGWNIILAALLGGGVAALRHAE